MAGMLRPRLATTIGAVSRAGIPLADPQAGPAWNLAWLTPARCRLILATVVAFGFLSHLYYLHRGIPIGLTGDEAQYWVWSRQLDINYYSKGPLVAWIIRLSTDLFGHTMPAVRYPALVLGAGSTLCLYWLIRRLTGSHRTALGGVLLTHIVPMFIAGSVLMTIDPPFYFCWALASCLLVKALWDQTRWAWVAAGLVVAAGTLAKYAMLIWLVGAVAFVVQENRAALRSWRPWALAALGLLGLAPAVIWNARHDWVTLKHVSRQTGATAGGFDPLGPLEMLAGQFGALSPGIFILAVALFFTLDRELLPTLDQQEFFLRVHTPANYSYAATVQRLEEVEAVILAHPEVATVITQLGYNPKEEYEKVLQEKEPRVGQISVTLKPQREAATSASNFIQRLRPALAGFPDSPYRATLMDLADYTLLRDK